MKTLKIVSLITLLSTTYISAQTGENLLSKTEAVKSSIAVLSMDAQGAGLDNLEMGNLLRLELDKIERFEVLDKYDVNNILEKNGIDSKNCFGKSQLVEAGKLLNVDKILSGSAQKFGDKYIITLRLISVSENRIEKSNVIEYVHQPEDIQTIIRISIHDLFGIENDPRVVEMLIHFERPITNESAQLKLNGPRFGIQIFTGNIRARLMASKSEGGYESRPYGSIFGYQHEIQFYSTGDLQALFEFIGSVNAIETDYANISLTVLYGMRYHDWELGFGPAFRFVKMAEGYYDENDKWHIATEAPASSSYQLTTEIDSRGRIKLNPGLVIAFGRTFHSGYLNIPVNVYWSPGSEANSGSFGLMLGFNIAKRVHKMP